MKTTPAVLALIGALVSESTNAFIVAPTIAEVPDSYTNIQVDTRGANSNNNN